MKEQKNAVSKEVKKASIYVLMDKKTGDPQIDSDNERSNSLLIAILSNIEKNAGS